MDRPLRIGELANQTGLDVQTIRWYERIGLLRPPKRSTNGYRLYGEEDAELLRLIRQAKGFGLSLDEIRSTLALLDEGCCENVRHDMATLLEAKIAAIDTRIAELQALREKLQRQWSRVLVSAGDPEAEASCTPSSCVCLTEEEPLSFVQIEDMRRSVV